MKSSDNHTHLPTGVFGSWAVTSLRTSLLAELAADKSANVLRMFFYAITSRGWKEINVSVKQWMSQKKGRSTVAIVGTDHGLTEPQALELMQSEGIGVRLMETYRGVFHPKVVWLAAENRHLVWVGSNNLTRNGLLQNIEFAVVVSSTAMPAELKKWAGEVEKGSSVLTPDRFKSYKSERQAFDKLRARTKATTFTWSRKKEPKDQVDADAAGGDLILEVMPKETGPEGTQVQLPRKAVKAFFGLTKVGSQKTIILNPKGTSESRPLTMTVFTNKTVRLSVNDLEYGDRPCLIVFRKLTDDRVRFEIVPENIFPTRYKPLLAKCKKRTREGSRRWTIS